MKKSVSKKKSCSDKLMTLMIVCVLLSLTTLGIVVYDKFIRNNSESTCAACANK